MYVTELDRPWLETPFLFQGFFIRTENEIEEICRYCKFIQIDIELSDATILASFLASAQAGKGKAHRSHQKQRRSFWAWLLSLFRRDSANRTSQPAPGEFYEDTVSTADELAVAKSVYTGALDQVMAALDAIRRGDELAMPDLQLVTGAMVDSVLRNNTAMALLARMQASDHYTSAHALSGSIWAIVFGRHLGLDRESLAAVGLGGLLLDVGKTKLPKQILGKTDPLTAEDRAQIHSHVTLSMDIIRDAGSVDNRVLDMVATHHERYDGSGYPHGQKGTQIPIFGRIGGIVDSYTAMTSDRPYAAAMSTYDAMREFKALSDKHFQAEMVEQFIQAIGIFPAGTLVELNTGEVGVVLQEHKFSRLQPELVIILDADKQPKTDYEIVDLRDQDEPGPTVWIERGIEPGAFDIDPKQYFL